jgi:hypothetical protein
LLVLISINLPIIKPRINGKINKLHALSSSSLNCNNTIKIIRIRKDELDKKSPGGGHYDYYKIDILL